MITKPFMLDNHSRIKRVIERILKLPEPKLLEILERVIEDFSSRHRNIWKVFKRNFEEVAHGVPEGVALSEEQRCLIGAYFTHEYSVQAAAFLNPSIVPHPDQSFVPEGGLRVILSFRSIGEGHVSSIEFRTGTIDKESRIGIDEVSRYVETPQLIKDPSYDKHLFQLKLAEMNCRNDISEQIFSELGESFNYSELCAVVDKKRESEEWSLVIVQQTIETILWLAKSNYELKFDEHRKISEKVIFPVSENESCGIEDARFVPFADDDGEVTYYATYTAYNGSAVLPQLLMTKDFFSFKIITLNGLCVKDKGMALFPRKVHGKYAMLSRIDGENLYYMTSDNVCFWSDSVLLREPEYPWEFLQIGNCGSPLETEEGWLVLTHGVGAMRKYCIGALLLDLDDPSKVIGSLKEPLLEPAEDEREGYVPNVLYSCGSMIHNDQLIIPYAMSDTRSRLATIAVKELLAGLSPP